MLVAELGQKVLLTGNVLIAEVPTIITTEKDAGGIPVRRQPEKQKVPAILKECSRVTCFGLKREGRIAVEAAAGAQRKGGVPKNEWRRLRHRFRKLHLTSLQVRVQHGGQGGLHEHQGTARGTSDQNSRTCGNLEEAALPLSNKPGPLPE